jgi:hypothetical protein
VRNPVPEPQPLDLSALLAGVTILVLLVALGGYAYVRGTRHGSDEPTEPPAA